MLLKLFNGCTTYCETAPASAVPHGYHTPMCHSALFAPRALPSFLPSSPTRMCGRRRGGARVQVQRTESCVQPLCSVAQPRDDEQCSPPLTTYPRPSRLTIPPSAEAESEARNEDASRATAAAGAAPRGADGGVRATELPPRGRQFQPVRDSAPPWRLLFKRVRE
eukprot:GHVU01153756.1.p1 GENE.GHVU01153756.1~~GHVU01153756.1.p1  ORF type:complete len:165 (-),score=12.52 GHVU01153756.1:766-1260(-)